jgi:O-antigen/teichoic acid export membrane protein
LGIIQRQSIKGTLVFIIGAAIHFLTMLWLMPNMLNEADLAVYRVYFSLIAIFSVVGLGGISSLIVKHVGDFDKKSKQLQVFNFVTLLATIVFALLTIAVIYASKSALYSFKKTQSPYLLNYFYCIPISTFFYILQYYFEAYCLATHRLTAPSVVKEILLKVLLLVGVVLYYFKYVTIGQFFLWYAFSYAIGFFILMMYCILIRGFRISWDATIFKQINFKAYLPYTIFIFMFSALAACILNLDQVVIYGIAGSTATDIYGYAVTTAAMITIPYKPLSAILLPFMYEAWKNNDLKKINEINTQSAQFLSAIGSLLFLLLVANADNIIILAPKFAAFKWPLLIIGFGRVLDFLTGSSTELLLTSPTYKKMIPFMVATFLFSLMCYKIFIPTYQEVGAAVSCTLTLIFFNVLKFIHLRKHYQLQPVHRTSIYFILLSIALIALQIFIPKNQNFILDIIVRSAIITSIYLATLYFCNWLPIVNTWVNKKILKAKHQ